MAIIKENILSNLNFFLRSVKESIIRVLHLYKNGSILKLQTLLRKSFPKISKNITTS